MRDSRFGPHQRRGSVSLNLHFIELSVSGALVEVANSKNKVAIRWGYCLRNAVPFMALVILKCLGLMSGLSGRVSLLTYPHVS